MRLFSWSKISIVLLVFFTLGCASSTPIKKAPLNSADKQELRQALVGSWTQTHRKEKNGQKQPLKVKISKWEFRSDGTFTLTAGASNPMTGNKTTNTRSGSWYLKGRNLAIGESGNESVRFRIEEWGNDKLVWFDYNASTYHYFRPE